MFSFFDNYYSDRLFLKNIKEIIKFLIAQIALIASIVAIGISKK